MSKRFRNLTLAAPFLLSAPCLAQIVVPPASPLQSAALGVWQSQQECEAQNRQSCVFMRCPNEIYGGDPYACHSEKATGWRPKSTVEAQQPAQGQQ